MALNPVNYNIDVASPIDQYFTGLKDRTAIDNTNAQTALTNAQVGQFEQKTIADNLKAQAMQQQQQQANDAFLKLKNPNATADDYRNASLFLPKDQSEASLKIWESKDKEEQKNLLTNASQVFGALNSNNQQLAQDLATKAQTAYKNSGDDRNAKALSTWLETIKTSPELAKAMIGATIGGLPEGGKILEFLLGKPQAEVKKTEADTQNAIATTAKTKADTTGQNISNLYAPQKTALELQNTQSTIAKNQAEIQNIGSQIDERQTKLANPELASDAQKRIYEAQDTIRNNDSAISSIDNILGQFDTIRKQSGGILSKNDDRFNKLIGDSGIINNVRTQINALNAKIILANKPPGSFSDADLKFAQSTIIDATSNPDVIERYLNVSRKILDTDKNIRQNEVSWVSQNGGLGNARKDLEINGVLIPRGTKFSEFNKAPATSKSYLKY